jgi:hypothetical protein
VYSTCIGCYRPLGANQQLASLPVGRMLAFDPERGRLWVICTACRRWNLAPIEERWEAIEEAARVFRGARRRIATAHVALATLANDVSLVCIGRAHGPEFAAWRYGTRLFGRWLRNWRAAEPELTAVGIGSAMSLAASGATVALGLGAFPVSAALLAGLPAGFIGWSRLHQRRNESALCWVWSEAGVPVPVTVMGGATAELRASSDLADGWSLSLVDFNGRREYEGALARRILASVLAYQNRFGARQRVIESAVTQIEEIGESEAFLQTMAHRQRRSVALWPRAARLALEMSIHETTERRALAGDLAELEAEWREAEEIASIADDLVVPHRISQRLHGLRKTARRSS